MWATIASLALNQINKNKDQEQAVRDQELAGQRSLLREQQQGIQQRTNLDLQNIANQGNQGATNPILDDIMKKYGAGRYSA